MNATLLCPGPSLAKYQTSDRSGMVVGVNRAASLHPCDVWAATDITLIKRVRPLGNPILLTISATRDSLARRCKPWPWLVITHDGVAGGVATNGANPWTRYTACAALAYLSWAKADRVDCWGVDWDGVEDWDGETDASDNRGSERWANERRIWDQTVERSGMKVVRHT